MTMRFMVEGRGNGPPTDEMLALFPAEQARGREFDSQGLRVALYVATDFSVTWQVFAADTQADVQRALESLPMYRFGSFTITPLADG
jgi:muconolactone delta-isomerase